MRVLMKTFKRAVGACAAVALLAAAGGCAGNKPFDATVTVDASKFGGEPIHNIVSNINSWGGGEFIGAVNNEKYDCFKFVEYIQLMQCSGGEYARDLFENPEDTSVLDDYKFDSLIEKCRGVLALGAKPHLKLGGVPMKYTSGAELGGFSMNIYPPDDYNVYYDYIKALALALKEAFPDEDFNTWRFGCMTEYENADWFMAKSGDPAESAVEYCKLYDYTVKALTDVFGNEICVGAHSMTVTEGLWDEKLFIKHVAEEKNYATGKTGTRCCFLNASFYDSDPVTPTGGKTLAETAAYLQDAAAKYGLDIFCGIDEGRILSGVNSGKNSADLLTRMSGYTLQGAYDARLIVTCIRNNIDYFSSWGYLSGGAINGFPSVSYHVAENFSKFKGAKLTDISVTANKHDKKAEFDCISAFDESTNTLRIMAYNFKYDLDYAAAANVHFDVNVPALDGKNVKITKYAVDDNCNFFDEWQADRKAANIGDECFSWSPDDFQVDSAVVLEDEQAREFWNAHRDGYEQNAQLTPVSENGKVENGSLSFDCTIPANSVVFYEIAAN